MYITRVDTGENRNAVIENITDTDLKGITKKRYSFNWKIYDKANVYKLTAEGLQDILGLMALEYFDSEYRIEIKLLAASKENVGTAKLIERIAGNLISFAIRLAIKKYGATAAISLVPKTILKQSYVLKYGFEEAGKSLFLEGNGLLKLLKEYRL